ncbi:MAG TPA: hypothetical protein VNT79_06440 [Phycisphaerae bacterium]|nr:hypothetical protein [Phycisphaerae bacterium]
MWPSAASTPALMRSDAPIVSRRESRFDSSSHRRARSASPHLAAASARYSIKNPTSGNASTAFCNRGYARAA